ncbi:uncharacterized protein LOC127751076 [Frankliniella occidentalis]|uniref:Uncharacterized protein LOC127751076 n=1 Tax=Frankliniella occidentalis TaxID=133901 RepID=A0A9C6X6G6_FRAOC|nr:uncharacterized protein LOC127751076 [Frankliniella occidentalis]
MPAHSVNCEDGLADYHLMLHRASPLPSQLLWQPPTPYPERDLEELVDAAPNPVAELPAALPAPYLIPGPAIIHEEEPQMATLDLTPPPLVINISDDEDDEPLAQAQAQEPAAAVAYWPQWHQPEPHQEAPVDLRERIAQLRAARHSAPQPARLQPWRSQAP